MANLKLIASCVRTSSLSLNTIISKPIKNQGDYLNGYLIKTMNCVLLRTIPVSSASYDFGMPEILT